MDIEEVRAYLAKEHGLATVSTTQADGRVLSSVAKALRLLLREVFQAASGTHDDFDEFDRVMADEGRVAVFVTPERILGNY
jgi:hypothetical protein